MSQTLKSEVLDCSLIGEGSLLIRCAQLLLDNGHKVCVIFTTNETVAGWAREHGIRTAESSDRPCSSFLQGANFDFLFSFSGESALPDEPQVSGVKIIHFHDSLLPRYADNYATTWALMCGETLHGVTWYESAGAGEVGILKQKEIHIEEEDTAFSLNIKCFQAAIDSFDELLGDLRTDNVKKKTRLISDSERNYLDKFNQSSAGILPWDAPAEEISRYIKALDFNVYENKITVPKTPIAGEFIAVKQCEKIGRAHV